MRPRTCLLLGVLLAAACGDDAADDRVSIELELPADDSGGTLLDDLDQLVFDVSQDGELRARQVYALADGLPGKLSLDDVPVGDDVVFHLTGKQVDAEVAYGRTCALNVPAAGDGDTIVARLYFSTVGRFRDGAAPLDPARRGGLMFSDDKGIAFVAGGSEGDVVELFDARDGVFAQAGAAASRMGGALAVRTNGTAVVAGGVDPDGMPVGLVEEILPRAADDEHVQQIGPDQQPVAQRTGIALAAIADGSVLLAGGRDGDGLLSADVSLLSAGDDRFRPTTTMAAGREGLSASVGLGGVVYLIGGLAAGKIEGEEAPTGAVELYRPQDQTLRPIDSAALAVPRFRHTATVLADGRILIVGGLACASPCSGAIEAVEEVEIFDPVLGETRMVLSGAPIAGGIYDHTATVVAGGRVLITGGRDSEGMPRDGAWLFDPDVEALVPTRELAHPRAQHTATELCDGTVLLVGGATEDGESLPSERYNPASRGIP